MGRTNVEAVNARAMIGMFPQHELRSVARDVSVKLVRVIESL